MTIVTLDSNDTAGILADAGITLDKPEAAPGPEAKPEAAKTLEKADPAPAGTQDDPDDVEGDDGLTPRQKREMTATMQKTIGKKHRMQKEAEEFAASEYNQRRLAEQRATNLEQELAALKAKTAPEKQAPAAAEPPQRDNFANEAAYVDAMIQWGVDKRLAEKAEEDRVARAERDRSEVLAAAKKRIDHASEVIPDFSEVVGAVDTEVPPAVAGYMQKSEMFAELAYHLAKTPDLLVSLAKLPPDEQLVKIGKIESTLTPFEARKEPPHDDKSSDATPNGKAKAAPSTETDTGIDLSKPRSKPAPVFTPLEGSGSAGNEKDSKDMNIRESIEDFAKRNRTNLNARKRH
jgi:hypothetical protein